MTILEKAYTQEQIELIVENEILPKISSRKSLIEFLNFTPKLREEKDALKPTLLYMLRKVLESKKNDYKIRDKYYRIISDWFYRTYGERFDEEEICEPNERTFILSRRLSKRI